MGGEGWGYLEIGIEASLLDVPQAIKPLSTASHYDSSAARRIFLSLLSDAGRSRKEREVGGGGVKEGEGRGRGPYPLNKLLPKGVRTWSWEVHEAMIRSLRVPRLLTKRCLFRTDPWFHAIVPGDEEGRWRGGRERVVTVQDGVNGGGDSKCAAVARSLHALLAEVDKRG